MDNILITSGVVSIVISVTISFITFQLQYNYDKKKHHKDTAINKLERAYNPLLFDLQVQKLSCFLSEAMLNVIREHGHLFTLEIHETLVKLVEKENALKGNLSNTHSY